MGLFCSRRFLSTGGLLLMVLLWAVPLRAGWEIEEAKINFLLGEVGRVEGVFIRNGKAHSPEAAVAHLKMKLENAMNSWFAPDKEQWTAELFIEKIASKSSISGKPYQIRFHAGETVSAGKWLRARLKAYTASH